MNDLFTKIKAMIEQYKPWSFVVLIIAGFLLLKKLMPVTRRRRKRVNNPVVSVNTGRRKVKRVRKDTGSKKAWQIKGSPEAKRRMAQLRRLRRK